MSRSDYAFVRGQEAPILPPPASEVGPWGWLWRNMFASMSNFSTPGAGLQSALMIVLTVGIGWFGLAQIFTLLDFAVFNAVWEAPEGVKREACATVAQGGQQAEGWFGACYPFISARWEFLIYGFYPNAEQWRVNLVFLIGVLGVAWTISDSVPRRRVVGAALIALGVGYGLLVNALYDEALGMRVGVQMLLGVGLMFVVMPRTPPRKLVGLFMLTLFPIGAFVLLTGGRQGVSGEFIITWSVVAAALLGFGFAGGRGLLGAVGDALGGTAFGLGVLAAALVGAAAVVSLDYGMPTVETDKWGGLLVTLVVAISGIVFSLPLGVLLALGRRSSLPAVRVLSVVFIEFWRGVPLITVLFMSSVMLPLFLPQGVEFNKLLRALIGVMFFSAAYQAEVVRGGLQAIPKGQFEGAMAIGLPYWGVMRLIILPQALALVIPGIVNTFIGLFKDTTLVLIIGLLDLLGSVQSSLTDASWGTPVQAPTGYVTAALLFWLFCFGMSRYSMYMERKLRRGHAR